MVNGAPSNRGRISALGLIGLFGTFLPLCGGALAQQIEVPAFVVGSSSYELRVAAGEDGGMAFVWADYGTPAVNDRGWSRGFNADGTPRSDATRLDLNGHFGHPDIAALPGGGYITSTTYFHTQNNRDVLGRFLDAQGVASGAPFQVQLESQGVDVAAVTAIASGPVFLWHSVYPWVRRVGFAGQPLAPPIHADDDPSDYYSIIFEMAPLPNGGFVAAWFDFTRQITRFRLFGADGLPSAPIVELPNFFLHHVAARSPGGLAFSGRSGSKLVVRRFDFDGDPVGAEIVVFDPSSFGGNLSDLDFDQSGNLYVLWAASVGNVPLPIRVDIYDADGIKVAPTTDISTSSASYLSTTRLANGNFVNAWVWGYGGTATANVVSVCSVQQTCGNGSIDGSCEQCDEGAANSDTQPDACRTTCKPASCGDHVIDSNEECDDGNHINGDGCDLQCRVEVCGNSRIEGGEGCDDGNVADADGCDSNCRPTGCGNGVLTAGEECDDGNQSSDDGCDQNCLVEFCGNDRVEAGEECDDGANVDGDGCDSDCTNTRCGNGILTGAEECDDANNTDGDGCDRICLIQVCGNDRLEGGEACDDANVVDGDGCQGDCTLTPRFDAVLDALRPISIPLSASSSSRDKAVTITLRNADTAGLQILKLVAGGGTCPASFLAGAPDFDSRIDGAQDTVALLPGEKARARLVVHVARGTFTAADAAAPFRCTIEIEAVAASGNAIDDVPTNGRSVLDVEVFDRGASSDDEIYVQALKPVKLYIPRGILTRDRSIRVRARSVQAGAAFNFSLDSGDCPLGTVSLLSQDPLGSATINIHGARAFVTTPRRFSPQRCTAMVTAASASTDTDPGNNTTPLIIDLYDDNDTM